MDKVAVLIPCYNESKTVKKVVEDFRKALPEAAVYVYDNNSTDETARLAREAGAIVRPEPRQGKGNVVRTMFRDIEADCYLMVDGDDTYPASQAAALCAPVLEGRADMVIGDRLSSTYFTENKRPFHNCLVLCAELSDSLLIRKSAVCHKLLAGERSGRRRCLRQNRHLLCNIFVLHFGNPVSADDDTPRFRANDPPNGLEHGGFSAPVCTDHRRDLSCTDLNSCILVIYF